MKETYNGTITTILAANSRAVLSKPIKLLKECADLFRQMESTSFATPRETNLLRKIEAYIKKQDERKLTMGKSNTEFE